MEDNCKICKAFESCHTPFMGGEGAENPWITFVGDFPGERDDTSGKPFAGHTGKLIQEILAELGGDISKCRFEYAVKCKPPAKLAVKTQKLCKPFIEAALEEIPPRVIVTLGSVPASSLLKNCKITEARGEVQEYVLPNGTKIPVVPTFHPNFVFRNPSAIHTLAKDIGTAWTLASTGETPTEKECVYRCVQSESDVEQFLAEMEDAIKNDRLASFDIETTGLDPYAADAKVVCFQVSFRSNTGWLFLLEHPSATAETISYGMDILTLLLEEEGVGITGHNLKFDLGYVSKVLGINPSRGKVVFDSCVAAHLLDENATMYGGAGLKDLAKLHTDKGGYEEKIEAIYGGKDELYAALPTMPVEHLIQYACGDTDVAYRIMEYQLPRIQAEGKLWDAMRFELDYKLPFIISLMQEGACIDEKLRVDLITQYEGAAEYLERKLRHYPQVASTEIDFGDVAFNSNSTRHLSHLYFEKLDLPRLRDKFFYTETGAHSTGKAVVEEWLSDESMPDTTREILLTIGSIKKLKKVVSTYLTAFGDLRSPDGRVHPNINNIGTVTWRLSMNAPNFQNIPRGGVVFTEIDGTTLQSDDIKKVIVSPGPDYVLMEADLAQIELRIAALFSQDKEMLDSFDNPDLDMHRILAARVFGIEPKAVSKEQRQLAKTANFGAIYLIMARSLAKKLRISDKQAEKFLREFFHLFKGYKRWAQAMEKALEDTGVTEGLFGHRRHVPLVKAKDEKIRAAAIREGINFPIQNTASNMTIHAGERARRKFIEEAIDGKFILSVHDSVVWWVHKSQAEKSAQIVLAALESPLEVYFPGIKQRFKRLPPIKAEVKSGPSWGEMKEGVHV